MDGSTRMVFVAGILMLALLIAVIGSVSADSVTVHAMTNVSPAMGQQL